MSYEDMRPGTLGGVGRANSVDPEAAAINKSDTINGMIDLLNHPIQELLHAVQRLSSLNDRISGPRPTDITPPGGGEIRKEHPSMAFRFADKHSEFARLTSAIHAEITKLDQVL